MRMWKRMGQASHDKGGRMELLRTRVEESERIRMRLEQDLLESKVTGA